MPCQRPHMRGGERSRGGTGFEQAHWETAGGPYRGDAAAREHNEKARYQAAALKPRRQLLQVAGDALLHVNIGDCCAGALELADLRRYLAAERHAHLGRRFRDNLARAPLVQRIAETVQISDADRTDSPGVKLRGQAPHTTLVKRTQHATVRGRALRNVKAQVAWDQRFRKLEVEIVQFVAVFAPDLKCVAKPRGGKQGGGRPFALDQSVGNQRGAMD